MTRKFVVATDTMAESDVKELQSYLTGHGWWKWLPSFWLIADTTEELTAESIRDKIHELDRTVRAWVFEVEPKTFAALTRQDSKGRDGVDWVRNNFMEE
ncbi:hypothetical protein [Bradyrhizobium sp. Bra64]|uniref:hypothetical protein n=1 Tax=Bradyrhizobium sp. Bra64 TaxID=2926009 RepID=UPI002118979B|nr:hypothetical protein [Bradyrhizobium sp. Bra64]